MKLSLKITTFILSAFVVFFASCKKEQTKNEETTSVRIPPDNRPPVANAGTDATIILPVNTILLSGYKSYDPDRGDKIASYKWSKIYGPANFILENENDPVSIAKSLVEGTYLFQLIVADTKGLTSKDTVLVRVDTATVNTNTGTTNVINEHTLIFENLTFINDHSENLLYMQTPPIPAGYSLNNVLSVSVLMFDFDYLKYIWKAIRKGGSEVGFFYYKFEGNTIVVYEYYGVYNIYNFVKNKIKVEFK